MPYTDTSDYARLKNRREIMRAMQKQAMEPSQTQMVSGIAVPMSPFEGLANMAQGYYGRKGQEKIGEEEKALKQEYGQGKMQAIQDAMLRAKGDPSVTSQYGPKQPVSADRMGAVGSLAGSQYAGEPTVDAITKALLEKEMGTGSSSTKKEQYTYQADGDGNFWRFDVRGSTPPQKVMANGQPIGSAKYNVELQQNLAGSKEQGGADVRLAMNPQIAGATKAAEVEVTNPAAVELAQDKSEIAIDQAEQIGDIGIADKKEIEQNAKDIALDMDAKIAGEVKTAQLSADRKQKLIANKPIADNMLSGQTEKTEVLYAGIDKAIQDTSGWTAGMMGQMGEWIGGTPMHDLGQTLLSIKSNIGLDRLMELKKSGGTLGSVTEAEHKLLQADIASLDQSQSPEQLKANLATLREHVKRSWERVDRAYKYDYGSLDLGVSEPQTTPQSAPTPTGFDDEKESRYQEWKARQ